MFSALVPMTARQPLKMSPNPGLAGIVKLRISWRCAYEIQVSLIKESMKRI